jgi:hypothetical protein
MKMHDMIYFFLKQFSVSHLQELCPTIHPVHNLKLNHHDHPETVSVTLYVKNIAKESLRVDFGETCISVTFRTRSTIIFFTFIILDNNV